MYHIIDNVYLSNLLDAENLELIKKNDIGVVCRLSDDRNESIYDSNIKFFNFECEDNIMAGDEMLDAADRVFNIIINSSKNVLVHCNEGQSRSVSVIIYYMIKHNGFTFDMALSYIKSIKPDVKPNSTFEKKLQALL